MQVIQATNKVDQTDFRNEDELMALLNPDLSMIPSEKKDNNANDSSQLDACGESLCFA